MKKVMNFVLLLVVLAVGILMVNVYAGTSGTDDKIDTTVSAVSSPAPTGTGGSGHYSWHVKEFYDYGVQSVTSTSAVIAVGYDAEYIEIGYGEPVVDYAFMLRYWEAGTNDYHDFERNMFFSFPKRLEKTITNLKPNTKYYYQFFNEPVNSFTTAKSDWRGSVDFQIQNYNSGSTSNVTIKNTGNITIQNWKLKGNFTNSAQITQMWCANYTQDGTAVEITPMAWNNVLAPGASITIGFNTSGPIAKPLDLELWTENSIVDIGEIPSEPLTLVDANSQFAFDLFKQINTAESGNNVFISPLSISTAIAMLYEGANGETRDEIAKTLGYYGIDIDKLNNDYQSLLQNLENVDPNVSLQIGNSLWYQESLSIRPDFINTNKEVFQAETMGLDLTQPEAADTINQWISNATNGMISHMVDPPLMDKLILINALYFKGAWTKTFDAKLTKKSGFKTESGISKTVDMMWANETTAFGKGEDYSAIQLPYGNKKVSMYCILPAEGFAIDSFISGLSAEKFNQIKKSLTSRSGFSVCLPKFKMAYGAKSLKTALNALGMNQAFSSAADFSGITSEGFGVGDVLHKAVIDVNETGTEAAAVTTVVSPGIVRDYFHANRPFVFIIADDTTGTILFMGKAANLGEY